MADSYYINNNRDTYLCIDSYDNSELRGRIYNPGVPEGAAFTSTIEFMKLVESSLNTMKLPRAFTSVRSFGSSPVVPPIRICEEGMPYGTVDTFVLQIVFRQNSSWQGALIWPKEERRQSFRSFLEVLYLLDSALTNQSMSQHENADE